MPPATIQDVHDLARAMPHVTVYRPDTPHPVYQVGGKSFVFFRTSRPDARFDDVIVFWVGSEEDKLALVQDPGTPFFTTAHFDGHPSVLLRGAHVGEPDRAELAEIVQDAWLAQASRRRAAAWLAAHPT